MAPLLFPLCNRAFSIDQRWASSLFALLNVMYMAPLLFPLCNRAFSQLQCEQWARAVLICGQVLKPWSFFSDYIISIGWWAAVACAEGQSSSTCVIDTSIPAGVPRARRSDVVSKCRQNDYFLLVGVASGLWNPLVVCICGVHCTVRCHAGVRMTLLTDYSVQSQAVSSTWDKGRCSRPGAICKNGWKWKTCMSNVRIHI